MKQKWEKGWKVITRYNRTSCSEGMYKTVKYKKGVVVGRPKGCGPLAVFKTRESARKFKRTNTVSLLRCGKNWKIVKCTYIKSKCRELWEWNKTCYNFPWHPGPPGTDFADSVTCLE